MECYFILQVFKTPVKRAKTKVTPQEMQQQIFMKTCTDALKNCGDESESTAFGKFIATKHAKLNETQKMYAETLITKILHKAALNKLTEDTSILDPQPQVGNTFSPRSFSSSGIPSGSFNHHLQVKNTSSSSVPSSATPSPTPSPGSVEDQEYLQNAGHFIDKFFQLILICKHKPK